MKVILQQDIRGKGKRGQMIEVSDGYARNYMLPRKLAVEATADNVNTMRMNDKATQERQARERAEAMELSDGYYYSTEDTGYGLMVRTEDLAAITSADDLSDKTVVVQSGSIQESFLNEQVPAVGETKRVSATTDGFLMVQDSLTGFAPLLANAAEIVQAGGNAETAAAFLGFP